MKIISTLLIALLCVNFTLNAQNSCASPQVVTPGTHTVTEVMFRSVPLPEECADNFGGLRTREDGFNTLHALMELQRCPVVYRKTQILIQDFMFTQEPAAHWLA